MTKREARVLATKIAYEALQKAVQCGGDEAGLTVEAEEDQIKIDNALDDIAQVMYERWKRLEERQPTKGKG